MRIDSEQLPQHLQKTLAVLYVVTGDEPLLAMEAGDLIRAKAREAGYGEREIFTVEAGFDWSDLRHSSNNLSLFGDRRLLDIRVPSGKPGNEGGAAIEAYCEALPPDVLTLVTLPKLDRQGQAAKWFKALERAGVMVTVQEVARSRLPPWIGRRLQAQGQSIDQETLEFLADKVEGNLLAAFQEVQKLGLLYPAEPLSFGQVKDAVLDVARYDVFDLADAMLAGDAVRYARILDGLQGEGVAPPLILGTLAAQVRALAMIRKGLDDGRPLHQLFAEARVWGERQRRMEQAARRLSYERSTGALLHAARIDRVSKGLQAGDVWDELLQMGLSIIRPAAEEPGRQGAWL